jgi:N-acetylglucosaminyl-diphospho-decaprenol L-rhamnosyltransferase
MTEIDFIVLDLDGGEMLARCLRSIDAQREVAVRVIVVDNGSTVRSAERTPALAAPVEHIRFEANRGFAGGANAGLAASRAELVALINNDVVLDSIWAATLASTLADPAIAAAQSVISATDGSIDGAGIGIEKGRFVQVGHQAVPSDELAPLWGVSATAAVFRRSALEAIRNEHGYFDERFFAYFEDVELSARLIEGGYSFKRVDQPLAVHAGSATAHRLGSRSVFLRTRNRYYVARLHRGTASDIALLHEDFRRVAGLALKGRLRAAGTVMRGLLHGLTDRLRA